MSSSPAHALHPTERETPAIAAEPAPTVVPVHSPVTASVLAARWFRLNKGRLRAMLIGALSLVAFLILWHLLTKYRIVFFVRFTNVPSPLAVYESFTTAIHDPKFLMHVLLSCRRIIFGFSLAALVAVPLGLIMGRFKLIHEIVFPVSEVLRRFGWEVFTTFYLPNWVLALVLVATVALLALGFAGRRSAPVLLPEVAHEAP